MGGILLEYYNSLWVDAKLRYFPYIFHGEAGPRHGENAHANDSCLIKFLWGFSPHSGLSSPWVTVAGRCQSLREMKRDVRTNLWVLS